MIEFVIRKDNYCVEVEPHDKWVYRNYGEEDAKDFAEYVMTLKNVKAHIVWDTTFVCPNCKNEAKTKRDLIGCCEMTEVGNDNI